MPTTIEPLTEPVWTYPVLTKAFAPVDCLVILVIEYKSSIADHAEKLFPLPLQRIKLGLRCSNTMGNHYIPVDHAIPVTDFVVCVLNGTTLKHGVDRSVSSHVPPYIALNALSTARWCLGPLPSHVSSRNAL